MCNFNSNCRGVSPTCGIKANLKNRGGQWLKCKIRDGGTVDSGLVVPLFVVVGPAAVVTGPMTNRLCSHVAPEYSSLDLAL